MTEYWKSNPKKFCDVCKCWFTDNKASIEFHERGSRHKANVQEKLHEARQAGKSNLSAQSSYEKELQKIEAAALSAYAKDLSTNPSVASQYGSAASSSLQAKRDHMKAEAVAKSLTESHVRPKPSPAPTTNAAGPQSSKLDSVQSSHKYAVGLERAMTKVTDALQQQLAKQSAKKWQEAHSEDGYSFFWHIDTHETRWDPPVDGYVSIADQMEAEGISAEEETIPALRTKPLLPALDETSSIGGWVKVEPDRLQQSVDYQIPERSSVNDKVDEIYNQVLDEEYAVEFKTKVAKLSTEQNSAPVAFKKRVFTGDSKRQVKKREE